MLIHSFPLFGFPSTIGSHCQSFYALSPAPLISATKAGHNALLNLPSVIPETQVYLSQLSAIHNNCLICHNFQHSSVHFHLEMQRGRIIVALQIPALFPIW